jgi:hypothetical protein
MCIAEGKGMVSEIGKNPLLAAFPSHFKVLSPTLSSFRRRERERERGGGEREGRERESWSVSHRFPVQGAWRSFHVCDTNIGKKKKSPNGRKNCKNKSKNG